MSGQKYLFCEDARKHRKTMLIFTMLFYICFIGLLSNVIASFIVPERYQGWRIRLIAFSILILLFAVYFTWALISKYLKFYMFITEDEIEFFADCKPYRYNITDFKGYSIIKTRQRYTVYNLLFTDKAYIICSFKSQAFEDALQKLEIDQFK